MTTRAKFKCVSVKKQATWNGQPAYTYEAEFTAVSGDSEENKQFFTWSPNGSIKLSTVREDHFEVGKEYYVDFTSAIAPAADAPAGPVIDWDAASAQPPIE